MDDLDDSVQKRLERLNYTISKRLPFTWSWQTIGLTEGVESDINKQGDGTPSPRITAIFFYTISIKSLNSQFATTPANRPLIVWYSMALAVKRVLCSSSIMDTCVLR